jgi:hypothetical protein
VKNVSWNTDASGYWHWVSQVGIPGQNMATPSTKHFADHALVEFGGDLYDPSYGSGPYNNLLDWQRAALAAFGKHNVFTGDFDYDRLNATSPLGVQFQ